MFVGFNVHVSDRDQFFSDFVTYGEELYKEQKEQVAERLRNNVLVGDILEASKLEEDWFPSINADVFISHSHIDENLAIGLAGFLNRVFGITSFIDSCVWGYANDLLNMLCIWSETVMERDNNIRASKHDQSKQVIQIPETTGDFDQGFDSCICGLTPGAVGMAFNRTKNIVKVTLDLVCQRNKELKFAAACFSDPFP